MWKALGAIMLVCMVLAAVKLAIILLILAGLIFRTKETLGLLTLGGVFSLLHTHPAAGLGLLGLLAFLAFYAAKNKAGSSVS